MDREKSVIRILIWRSIAYRGGMNANVVAFNPGKERSVVSNRPALDVRLNKIRVVQQEGRVVVLAPRPREICSTDQGSNADRQRGR